MSALLANIFSNCFVVELFVVVDGFVTGIYTVICCMIWNSSVHDCKYMCIQFILRGKFFPASITNPNTVCYFFIPCFLIHNFLLLCLLFVVMACLRDRLRLCLSTTVMRTLCSLYTVFCTISFINQFIHTKQLRPSQLMKII